MSRGRKAITPHGKLKPARNPKSRRGFLDDVARIVVSGLALDALHATWTRVFSGPRPVAIQASAITPGPPVRFTITVTFGAPVPQDEILLYRA
jgi:hypothetical protein